MAHTNALEADIAALKSKPQSPENKAAIEANVKQLSKVKLMKPFEYSHQGPSLRPFVHLLPLSLHCFGILTR